MTIAPQIPLVDLARHTSSIRQEIDLSIKRVLEEGSFVKSPIIREFEDAFANYIGTAHCIGVGNGTDALEISLKALGIGPGDEVIVPAMSWIATAAAVSNIGAIPVFVDIDPDTYNIDVALVEKAISDRTKAVIPVHLYGLPVDLDSLCEVAKRFGIHVIEDCAQAHGATYRGRKVGSFGIISAFSFFPSKNLGALGDGGAILTSDPELADKCRRIANHGRLERDDHTLIGRNSRLDAIQATTLLVKLKHLDRWNSLREAHASAYFALLSDLPLKLPTIPTGSTHVFHLYVIQTTKRMALMEHLSSAGIGFGIHYPKALPDLLPYKPDRGPLSTPIAEKLASNALSIPLFPEISDREIALVARVVRQALT